MNTEKMMGEEIKMQFIKSKKETLLKYWGKYPLFSYFTIYRKSFIYDVDGGKQLDYTSEYHSLSHFNKLFYNNLPNDLIKGIEDDSFFRYDQYGTGEVYNSALQQKLNGTTFYFSLSNKNVSEYLNEMYLNIHLNINTII